MGEEPRAGATQGSVRKRQLRQSQIHGARGAQQALEQQADVHRSSILTASVEHRLTHACLAPVETADDTAGEPVRTGKLGDALHHQRLFSPLVLFRVQRSSWGLAGVGVSYPIRAVALR